MGLGPRSLHKAGRRFPAGGKRGRGAKGSGRPPAGRPRHVCPPRDGCSEPASDAHPHLSPEALGYFRRALSALKEAPEAGEERGREDLPLEPRERLGHKIQYRQGHFRGSQDVGTLSFISRILFLTLSPLIK